MFAAWRTTPSRVVIDHNNEETVRDVLDRGFWAAFTLYPQTKMGHERMVEVARHQHLDVLHVHYAIPHATSAWIAKEMLGPDHPLKIVTTLHGTDITLVGMDGIVRARATPYEREALVRLDAGQVLVIDFDAEDARSKVADAITLDDVVRCAVDGALDRRRRECRHEKRLRPAWPPGAGTRCAGLRLRPADGPGLGGQARGGQGQGPFLGQQLADHGHQQVGQDDRKHTRQRRQPQKQLWQGGREYEIHWPSRSSNTGTCT